MSNSDWLVDLLKGMLVGVESARGKKEDKKRRDNVSKRCEQLVTGCVEFLLALEDSSPGKAIHADKLPFNLSSFVSPSSPTASSSSSSSLDTDARSLGLVAIIATLHVFCRSSPFLLVPHVNTLLPYLKGAGRVGQRVDAQICSKVANIITWTFSLIPEHEIDLQ